MKEFDKIGPRISISPDFGKNAFDRHDDQTKLGDQ